MRCSKARNIIHKWLDQTEAQAMPESIRTHVRDCGECKSFISRWNAIEVGLSSMRDQTPVPTRDFAAAVRQQLASDTTASRRSTRTVLNKLAIACLSAIILFGLFMVLKSVGDGRRLDTMARASGPNLAGTRSAIQGVHNEASPPATPDLPMATTP